MDAALLVSIIPYLVFSIVFFGSVYYFTNKWVEVQREKNKLNILANQKENPKTKTLQKHFFPLQVEAYQRMVLFLERIALYNMVMRLNNPGLPARVFQQKLLENVRQEYEHNLAQQIFISPEAWNLVQSSKEEVIKIINMAATNLTETSLANDLSKGVLQISAQLQIQPTDQAIIALKKELNLIIMEN